MKLLALSVFAASLALAAPKPDFSGNWKINFDKSDFGRVAKPMAWTRTIQHQGSRLVLASAQPKDAGNSSITLEIGGPAAKFQGDTSGTGSLQWEGDTLVFTTDTVTDHGGMKLHKVERWELAAGGKTLTAKLNIKSDHGAFDATFVFDKQP